MTDNEVYRIAQMAVKSAVLRGRYPFCEDDYTDMLQEAALTIMQCKPGMSEAYYFAAGRTAALNWLIWWRYGAPRDKLFGSRCTWLTPRVSSLDEIRDIAGAEPDQYSNILTEDRARVLWHIFELTRRKRSATTRSCIQRDVEICRLLCDGYNVDGIAVETGINKHTVNRYRELIRGRLNQWIQTSTACEQN